MEAIGSYLQANGEQLGEWGVVLGHAVVGCVLSALTLGCLYCLYFLAGVLRLQKGSREYYQLREHVMPESLLRYAITIACIFTIDALIVLFFSWGAAAMLLGTALSLLFLAAKEAIRALAARKAKQH